MLVVGLLLTFLVFRPPTSTTAAPVTRTVTVGATTSVQTQSSSPSRQGSSPTTATASRPTYPTLNLSGSLCGTVGAGPYANYAAGNTTTTSCAFAGAVREAFENSSQLLGVPLTVQSTTTGKSYQMTCSGDQPVTCTGGNNAIVFLYGGTATFSG